MPLLISKRQNCQNSEIDIFTREGVLLYIIKVKLHLRITVECTSESANNSRHKEF